MGKWAQVSDVTVAARVGAAEVLQERLAVIMEWLPLAAHHHDEDLEHVHQLRVSCRRASAALRSFQPLLPKKAKRIRQQLVRIRRAAGPARDADVLLLRLQADWKGRPGAAYLVDRLEQCRRDVQPALVEVSDETEEGKWHKQLRRMLGDLNQSGKQKQRFDEFARQALSAVVEEFFGHATRDDPNIAQLHELRIETKRLRYSIELFHSAFPKSLREEVYPQIESIQSKLGQLNDHATAQKLLQRWIADLPPGEQAAQLAQAILHEHEATLQLREDFLGWWRPDRIRSLKTELESLTEPVG